MVLCKNTSDVARRTFIIQPQNTQEHGMTQEFRENLVTALLNDIRHSRNFLNIQDVQTYMNGIRDVAIFANVN